MCIYISPPRANQPPLHSTTSHLLADWDLAPAQLTPNGWSYVLGVMVLLVSDADAWQNHELPMEPYQPKRLGRPLRREKHAKLQVGARHIKQGERLARLNLTRLKLYSVRKYFDQYLSILVLT